MLVHAQQNNKTFLLSLEILSFELMNILAEKFVRNTDQNGANRTHTLCHKMSTHTQAYNRQRTLSNDLVPFQVFYCLLHVIAECVTDTFYLRRKRRYSMSFGNDTRCHIYYTRFSFFLFSFLSMCSITHQMPSPTQYIVCCTPFVVIDQSTDPIRVSKQIAKKKLKTVFQLNCAELHC